jgi:hypothetical protein
VSLRSRSMASLAQRSASNPEPSGRASRAGPGVQTECTKGWLLVASARTPARARACYHKESSPPNRQRRKNSPPTSPPSAHIASSSKSSRPGALGKALNSDSTRLTGLGTCELTQGAHKRALGRGCLLVRTRISAPRPPPMALGRMADPISTLLLK